MLFASMSPDNASIVQQPVDTSLHVHDLPQLWQKPPSTDLLQALSLLAPVSLPFTFGDAYGTDYSGRSIVGAAGIPRYLTSIISSPLSWIQDENIREQIWSLASRRISERSGRTAQPDMTRQFVISEQLTVLLHEPSLTEDNLGLKTWASSFLLSRRLVALSPHIPARRSPILELGAGTGLVGISAACLWSTNVTLTDLPEIVPNLKQNLVLNAENFAKSGMAAAAVKPLDWSDTSTKPATESERYRTILSADPIYSIEHPRWLVDTIVRWLRFDDPDSRFVVELPLRDHYEDERRHLRQLLDEASLEPVTEGTETGYDDWQNEDGRPVEVECWWSVWRPAHHVEEVG